MNTTESDSNIDIEAIHDIVTTDFKGEKIERLLYQSGFDSEHKLGDEGVSVLEVKADNIVLVMSETWEASGEWFIDPLAIVLDVFEGDRFFRTFFPDDLASEEDLVEYIEGIVDNGVFW